MRIQIISLVRNGEIVYSGTIAECAAFINDKKYNTGYKFKSLKALLFARTDANKELCGFTVIPGGSSAYREKNYRLSKHDTRKDGEKFSYEPGCFNPKKDLRGKGVFSTPY